MTTFDYVFDLIRTFNPSCLNANDNLFVFEPEYVKVYNKGEYNKITNVAGHHIKLELNKLIVAAPINANVRLHLHTHRCMKLV